MAEISTVARPYAEAVFQLANESGALRQWSDALHRLSSLSTHPDLAAILDNPQMASKAKQTMLSDLLGDVATPALNNFVATLVENHRLALVPDIALQFEQLKANIEGILEAVIFSPFALSAAQTVGITTQLEKKYAKKVTASVRLAPELIGGVRIEIGDDVIDASVQGKLQAMAYSLKN